MSSVPTPNEEVVVEEKETYDQLDDQTSPKKKIKVESESLAKSKKADSLKLSPRGILSVSAAKPKLDPSAKLRHGKIGSVKLGASAPWDPLSVYIVDINNSPEQYLKTVDLVVSSRPPSNIVLLYNMKGLDISVKERFWLNYRMVRDDSGIVAQVHNKIKVKALSGKNRTIITMISYNKI